MDAVSLTTLVADHLTIAKASPSGRSSHTIHGGHQHTLRQTLIVLTEDHELSDHESPGEATLQVLEGTVALTTATDSWQLGAGDVATIPRERHGLKAIADCAVLLTVSLTA